MFNLSVLIYIAWIGIKVLYKLGLLKSVRKIRFEGSNPIRLSKLNFEKSKKISIKIRSFRNLSDNYRKKFIFSKNKKFEQKNFFRKFIEKLVRKVDLSKTKNLSNTIFRPR